MPTGEPHATLLRGGVAGGGRGVSPVTAAGEGYRVSERFLAAYVRRGLQTACQWQDSYDAAIAVAPDADSRNLMVRFAEQGRVRLDVLARLLHDLGAPAVATDGESWPDMPEIDPGVRWWRALHDLWTAECQAQQQVAVLRAVGETWGWPAVNRAVADLDHGVEERLHVLQAMTRQTAPHVFGQAQDLPSAA